MLVRHHVAHTGLLPEREDAELAVAAHRDFRGFVLDRLAASMRRYPAAVGMFVSEAGLKRRGAWTKKWRQMAAELDVDKLLAFTTWREAVLQARMR